MIGKAKETSWKTFAAKGSVGEVHRVNAIITAIEIITRSECLWCKGDCGPRESVYEHERTSIENLFIKKKRMLFAAPDI